MLADDEDVRGGGDRRGEGGDVTTVFLSAELSGRLDEDGGGPTTEPLPLATTADPSTPTFSEAMLIAARFLRDRYRLFRRSCSSVATLCCHLAAVTAGACHARSHRHAATADWYRPAPAADTASVGARCART